MGRRGWAWFGDERRTPPGAALADPAPGPPPDTSLGSPQVARTPPPIASSASSASSAPPPTIESSSPPPVDHSDGCGPVRDLALLLLAGTDDPRQLLTRAAEAARALLGADVVSISRFEDRPDPEDVESLGLVLGLVPGPSLYLPVLGSADRPPVLCRLVTVGRTPDPSEPSDPIEPSSPIEPSDPVGLADPRPCPGAAGSLRSPGAGSTLITSLHLGGAPWGELRADRAAARPRWAQADFRVAEGMAPLLAAGFVRAGERQRLQVLAWSDALTALANRRAFDERLTAMLVALESAPDAGGLLSVVLADVNGLKEVNDRSGHEAGDDVLRMVAAHARAVVADLPQALAARLGGDEFALLLPGLGSRRAYRRATRWCVRVADELAGVSLACGFSTYRPAYGDGGVRPDAGTLKADLVRAADGATYQAKRLGTLYPMRALG